MNAILYIAGSGCQWRALPKDFPPASTVRGYFYSWRDNRPLADDKPHPCRSHAGTGRTRGLSNCRCQSTVSRSKTTESGGISGYDAGKKIKGRKRHIITDTLGLMLFVLVHAADIQDRDGAPDVLKAIRHRFPWLAPCLRRRRLRRRQAAHRIDRLRHVDHRDHQAFRCCQRLPRPTAGDGWWNAPSDGLDDAAGSQRTGRNPSKAPPHGS